MEARGWLMDKSALFAYCAEAVRRAVPPSVKKRKSCALTDYVVILGDFYGVYEDTKNQADQDRELSSPAIVGAQARGWLPEIRRYSGY
jgi:hypothetical protein